MTSMFTETVLFLQDLEKSALGFSFALWAFAMGALIGSFLNVVIYRVPLGRSVVLPPSACTNCNTPLHWSHNLPIFSYFFLKGRCRFCGVNYSVRYAALELVSGLFFLWSQQEWGFVSLLFLKSVCLYSLCLVVFFIDLDHWIIPDGINAFGVVLGLFFSVLLPLESPFWVQDMLGLRLGSLFWSLLGGVTGFLFFWGVQVLGLVLVRQEAMGGGDVKFAALIGSFLGPLVGVWAFLLSFFWELCLLFLSCCCGEEGGKTRSLSGHSWRSLRCFFKQRIM